MRILEVPQRAFWPAVGVMLICGVVLTGAVAWVRADYGWRGQFISELGAVGAPYAAVVNWLAFLPIALSSAVALLCLRARVLGLARVGFVLVLVGLSVGYLWAFLFPCDLGCPVEGSRRQVIHNLSALVAYPVGTVGLAVLVFGLKGRVSGAVRGIIGAVALVTAVGFVMILLPEQAALRGFWQRLVDYSMFGLIAYLGVVLPVAK